MSSNNSTYQQFYKQRSAESSQQTRPSPPPQSYLLSSAYNMTKGGYNSSSGISSSTVAPVTPPQRIHSNSGYESDASSEGGREPLQPAIQKLGLRVVNPDDDIDLSPTTPSDEENKKGKKETPGIATQQEAPIKTLPLILDQQQQPEPTSEMEWRAYQQQQQQQQQQQVQKPDLPPHFHHHQPQLLLRPVVFVDDSHVSRHESKTLASSAGNINNNEYYYVTGTTSTEQQQQAVMMSSSSVPMIHQQQQQQEQTTTTTQPLVYQQKQLIDLPLSPVSPTLETASTAATAVHLVDMPTYNNRPLPPSPVLEEYGSLASPNFSLQPSPPSTTKSTTATATTTPSKYAKVSYHLTNDPNALKKYRDMAEKTNDPVTQLMFAKYLLETANTFRQQPYSGVVGSMWGLGSTTNKQQKPDPYLVVPPITEGGGGSSIASSSNPRTSLSNYQQQSLMNVTMKQQASLGPKKRSSTIVPSESNEKKRKMLEQEGVKWILKLSKQQVPEACYMQAYWMDNEMYGFKHSKTKSLALHQIAAKAHVPESIYAIAEHHYELEINDKNGEMEPARISKYYQTAANFGYVNAIYKLAFLTIHGNLGIRQSLTEGLKLMYKASTLSSEEFNLPPYTFALMLTNDYEQVDFPQAILDPYGGKEAAILYYERAAKLNNDLAQATLGSIYEHGLYGESINFARAFDYYEQASLNNNAKAMLGLCRLNNRGSHGPGDHDEAKRLENDVSGWLAATPINEDLAFSWCERSAKAGNVNALALLGWFYESGFGTPRDFGRAEQYYTLAAEKGDVGARSRLMQGNTSITKQQHEEIHGPSVMPTNLKKKKKNSSQKRNGCKCM